MNAIIDMTTQPCAESRAAANTRLVKNGLL